MKVRVNGKHCRVRRFVEEHPDATARGSYIALAAKKLNVSHKDAEFLLKQLGIEFVQKPSGGYVVELSKAA